jgi:V8-like Glu-specific endopeptidase
MIGFLATALALANPVDAGGIDLPVTPDGRTFRFVDLRPAGEMADGIWGGTKTSDYPNVVALAQLWGNGGYVFCSGTLIDNRWVITAAHCLDGQQGALNSGELYILFGNDILQNGYSDAIRFSDFHMHPDYDADNFLHDIGLVEMESDKAGVDFAVLNDEPLSTDWYGDLLTFVGFGITVDGANDAGSKRETDIPIDNYDAQYVYSENGTSNVCQGDSGGAAFETTNQGNLELVGINAFVYPGCAGGGNGATRVDAYMGWIQGYVPDVLLGGSGEGSGGTEDPEDNGEEENNLGGSVDLDAYDRDFGDVTTPDGARYQKALRCATGVAPESAGWVAFWGLLAVFARRRR